MCAAATIIIRIRKVKNMEIKVHKVGSFRSRQARQGLLLLCLMAVAMAASTHAERQTAITPQRECTVKRTWRIEDSVRIKKATFEYGCLQVYSQVI